ncbi:MAG: D-2-hydroxyacid dehydrogenase [Selenomonadales bacterium]|nr:D-2-hydroxyacid dehydrogenase [Selenomonadales bacterium]MBQ2246448.1 D-2-hydroxyacid dehydrogenase [Selenomonadales bacterium]MBQ5587272.1 D-2-hydroxyacid dehydrogenase [Selenomonadales bacterium]MBQ5636489.1 D-2-hydroxyacid dehydrogenase [Selenomonadales bacterium]MBQ5745426.1 D-2-hydroxyacid dehydrogenase [Selenomonadales bacterium]
MSLNIVVANRLSQRHIDWVHNIVPDANIVTCEDSELGQHLPTADILIAWGFINIDEHLPNAPRLRWIHALSAGVEKILSPTVANAPIQLTNVRGIHGIPMSEHVFGMMLAFSRSIAGFARQQQDAVWKRLSLTELYNKTLCIVGLGSIGREIAKRAKAFNMRIVATKQTMTQELFVDELCPPSELDRLLGEADYVVLTVPETPDTVGLFSYERICRMKESAVLINVARGTVVSAEGLAQALTEKKIAGAALDVFVSEPLSESSPLWKMDNVLITPHCAAVSPLYLDRAMQCFCENLSLYMNNKAMMNVIDKERGY